MLCLRMASAFSRVRGHIVCPVPSGTLSCFRARRGGPRFRRFRVGFALAGRPNGVRRVRQHPLYGISAGFSAVPPPRWAWAGATAPTLDDFGLLGGCRTNRVSDPVWDRLLFPGASLASRHAPKRSYPQSSCRFSVRERSFNAHYPLFHTVIHHGSQLTPVCFDNYPPLPTIKVNNSGQTCG